MYLKTTLKKKSIREHLRLNCWRPWLSKIKPKDKMGKHKIITLKIDESLTKPFLSFYQIAKYYFILSAKILICSV